MNADLLTIILLGVSSLILVVTETHVAFVTLAICAGYLLGDVVGPDLFNFFEGSVDPNSFPLYSTIQLGLLFIPAILIGHRFRRSQRGAGRFVQQLIPAFALSLLLIILIFDALPVNARETLEGESYIHGNLGSFASWIVVFAIGSAMFDVLIQHAGPKRKYKKRKRTKDKD